MILAPCNESLLFDNDETKLSACNFLEIYNYLPAHRCCLVMRGRSALALKSRKMPPSLSRRFDEGRPARARYVHHCREYDESELIREGGRVGCQRGAGLRTAKRTRQWATESFRRR